MACVAGEAAAKEAVSAASMGPVVGTVLFEWALAFATVAMAAEIGCIADSSHTVRKLTDHRLAVEAVPAAVAVVVVGSLCSHDTHRRIHWLAVWVSAHPQTLCCSSPSDPASAWAVFSLRAQPELQRRPQQQPKMIATTAFCESLAYPEKTARRLPYSPSQHRHSDH